MTAGLFPDVADTLCDLLVTAGLFAPDRVGTVGGSDDRVTDSTSVDVEVFAASIPAAMLLAEQVRQFLIAGPRVQGPAVFDMFATVSRPRSLPWGTPGVFRAYSTYRATARRMTV